MIYCILATLAFTLQNVCCKEYGKRFPNTTHSQMQMILLSSVIVTVIMALTGGMKLLNPVGYLITFGFGLAFVITLASMTIAMNCGHLGLTVLIQNSSLLVPVIFGVAVWHESLTAMKVAGIVCVFIPLILSSFTGSDPGSGNPGWNKRKWLFFTALAFLGDSTLAILQGVMSRACATTDSVTFTFWTSLFSAIIALAVLLLFTLRSGAPLFASVRPRRAFSLTIGGIGIGTAGGNCFTIAALTVMPSSILFPISKCGLLLLIWLIDIIVYREKATPVGWIMFILGLIGIALLSI